MVCVPAGRALLAQLALFVFPLPVSATALQPLSKLPLALKRTLPVGSLPVTLALNVIAEPSLAGFAELANAVLVAGKETPASPHASISAMRE